MKGAQGTMGRTRKEDQTSFLSSPFLLFHSLQSLICLRSSAKEACAVERATSLIHVQQFFLLVNGRLAAAVDEVGWAHDEAGREREWLKSRFLSTVLVKVPCYARLAVLLILQNYIDLVRQINPTKN